MIGRYLADLAFLSGFRVHAGISAADEPEDGWRAPLGSERSEVLAGRGRLSFPGHGLPENTGEMHRLLAWLRRGHS